ncbi:hypothetical protein PG988_011330 [Apiospora saccharicola]
MEETRRHRWGMAVYRTTYKNQPAWEGFLRALKATSLLQQNVQTNGYMHLVRKHDKGDLDDSSFRHLAMRWLKCTHRFRLFDDKKKLEGAGLPYVRELLAGENIAQQEFSLVREWESYHLMRKVSRENHAPGPDRQFENGGDQNPPSFRTVPRNPKVKTTDDALDPFLDDVFAPGEEMSGTSRYVEEAPETNYYLVVDEACLGIMKNIMKNPHHGHQPVAKLVRRAPDGKQEERDWD